MPSLLLPRIVVDTNVVFEGLTKQGGASSLIIDAWLAGLIIVCISNALAYEYDDVLSRKLSETRWRQLQPVLGQLLSMAQYTNIYFSWRPASPDAGDDLVIDCANECKCNRCYIQYSRFSERKRVVGAASVDTCRTYKRISNRRKIMSRLTLRLPETLHQQLAHLAESEGVSLNQYIVYALTRQTALANVIQVSPDAKVAQQHQAFQLLIKQLGQASTTEIKSLLATREQTEPEAELSSEVVARLQERIQKGA